MGMALDKEVTFKTIFRYRHIYPLAIEAVSSRRISVKEIVSNEFVLNDIQNAMDTSVRDKANVVKAVVKIC
ncbi:MAG: NAD(P)-dependent alcohol dehydrogenase, partial [Bacillota bacterium]|nr:NAD(P)-dependent alcohol dehydrogenase [Bacillota bacterium]